MIVDIEDDIMDPVMQCTTLPSHSGFSQKKLVSFVTEIHTLSIDISLRDCLDDGVAASFQQSRIHKPHAHTHAFKVNRSTSRSLILNFPTIKEPQTQVDQGSQIKMIQVKEMMQDNDLKNLKSKDKGSRSRSQSMNEQSHYKQDKTKTRQSINVKSHIFNVRGDNDKTKQTPTRMSSVLRLQFINTRNLPKTKKDVSNDGRTCGELCGLEFSASYRDLTFQLLFVPGLKPKVLSLTRGGLGKIVWTYLTESDFGETNLGIWKDAFSVRASENL
ncbi:hypothetical protein Tco_0273563 [Tanacetum coccineum]